MPTIHTIDLNYQNTPKTIAAYLLEGPDGLVMVECGPGSTIPALVAGLKALGYEPGDVGDLLVSHIHLDHAGAAGWWAQQGARVYVHHVGARHLIDPSRLWASASRIYGDQMGPMWGEMLPVPEAQLTALHDGDIVRAGGLEFVAQDTPGHARHHMIYRLGGIVFTGDLAAVHIPGSGSITIPAPPPEFELEVWQGSIDRLLEEGFDALYPTHFGRLERDGREYLLQLRELLVEHVRFIGERMDAETPRDQIVAEFEEWNRARVVAAGATEAQWQKYRVANPLYMSVDGIMRYWRKRNQST